MAALITYAQFEEGYKAIPNIDKDYIQEAVTEIITYWQEIWLTRVLGEDLYTLVNAQITSPDATYLKLVTDLKEPFACWVYYWYRRQNATHYTESGEVLPQTAQMQQLSIIDKAVYAINRMVELLEDIDEYLLENDETFPDYSPGDAFEKINEYGF